MERLKTGGELGDAKTFLKWGGSLMEGLIFKKERTTEERAMWSVDGRGHANLWNVGHEEAEAKNRV